jgi:hypothetical protein
MKKYATIYLFPNLSPQTRVVLYTLFSDTQLFRSNHGLGQSPGALMFTPKIVLFPLKNDEHAPSPKNSHFSNFTVTNDFGSNGMQVYFFFPECSFFKHTK